MTDEKPQSVTTMEPLSITAPTLLVNDIEVSKVFYRDKVGLPLFRSNESFANFKTDCAILALWEADHVARHLDCVIAPAPDQAQRLIMACELKTKKAVDYHYEQMLANGVIFLREPKVYPWNVYAAFFRDPDNYLWEIFTWHEGGPEAGGHQIFD
jgi:predicted lactoylglutathione lyase|tara:strand:- start:1121 stop:1585 length:465 start_codon:yes stop_codon:yes gene_type:complete